jgi:uncharacterized protein YraI
VDPGPAFPLDELRARLLNIDVKPAEFGGHANKVQTVSNRTANAAASMASVNASVLNVRTGPNIAFDKVSGEVNKGDKLTIIDRQGEWVKVSYTTTGWVNSRYINEVNEKLPRK